MSQTNSTFKLEIKYELAIIIGLSLALILAVYVWSEATVRIVIGLPYVCFFPGYTLIATLFPRHNDLSSIARTLLSFGLSIAAVSLIGLLLNYTPWGIRLGSILISLTSLTLACAGAAYCRRIKLAAEDRFVIYLQLDIARWKSLERLDKFLSILLALSILAAASAFVYAIAGPKTGEAFTEFYLLGPDGVAGEYPTEINAGEPITLIIGVANHEHAEIQYRIEKQIGASTEQIASLQLGHEETWEWPYAFTLNELGEHKVVFLLYKGNDTTPYRSLHLWITVEEAPLNHD